MLSDRDRQLLDFETKWRGQSGGKGEAIRQTFEVSAMRYYQMVNRVIDLPEALEYDAILVHHPQRERERRVSRRASRSFNESAG